MPGPDTHTDTDKDTIGEVPICLPGELHLIDPRLPVLIRRMEDVCPRVLEELQTHRRKQGHWAWWVFPTEKEGFCEPPPQTAVTTSTAPLLLQHAPPQWRQCLEMVLNLAEASLQSGGGGIRSVLPRIDHDRVRYFAAFWSQQGQGGEGEWIRDLALQFKTAFELDPSNKWRMIDGEWKQSQQQQSQLMLQRARLAASVDDTNDNEKTDTKEWK